MRRSVLVWLLTAILLAAGCSVTTAGTPTPGGSSGQPETSTPTKPSVPSTSANPSPLADIGPCDLMPASAATALGFEDAKGEEEKIGRARSCSWKIRGATLRENVNLGVAIFDTLGIADIVAKGQVETLPPIGKHDAVRFTGIADNCVFTLGVTKSVRVDIVATGSLFEKSCDVASRAAKLVEPELP
ncbi:DUF3558 domain-containing protein [Actinokineospora sp.]|uniref:DUF3558 domain-containing protein n=1 Tax=Actinokineospora sp. TaxID=1872133 RepID=UPI004037EA6E